MNKEYRIVLITEGEEDRNNALSLLEKDGYYVEKCEDCDELPIDEIKESHDSLVVYSESSYSPQTALSKFMENMSDDFPKIKDFFIDFD